MTISRGFLSTFAGILTLLLSAPTAYGQVPASNTPETAFEGKVVPMATLLRQQGVKLDRDAGPHWLALVTNAGKVHPLVKDDGSRLLFKDPELHNRPMRLTGKLLPGSDMLTVTCVQSIVDGKLCEVYYWCEFCALRDTEPGACRCCGRELERKEVPVEAGKDGK